MGGNSFRLGNRSINLARDGYRPSQFRRSWYRGYWGGGNWGRGGGGRPWGYGGGFGQGWGYGGGYGWGGGGGGYGWRPLGWGLGAWGLGSLIYNSGYLGYFNPYYGPQFAGVYDYSEPIPVVYSETTYVDETAEQSLNAAMEAFRQGNYDAALDIVNQAVSRHPEDAVLHEFRALVLFAKRDYVQAAATIHSVLALGPGWNWETLNSIYGDVGVYTLHLRALEGFVRENPEDAGARFLLAYHYMCTGHPDASIRHLERVVELVPEDRVGRDLLTMLRTSTGSSAAAAPEPTIQPPQEPAPAGPAIEANRLYGSWSAARDDGSRFELVLNPDSTFTWKFLPRDQAPQILTGKFTVEGNALALEREEGGSLVGEVRPEGDNRFNFKLLGAPESDRGLDFRK